jgi:SNF2 family DNA or RNA helicase
VADKYKNLDIKIVDVPFTDDKERQFYEKVQDEVKNEYLRILQEEDSSGAMMELFELLLRLRQATIHPNLVIKGLAKKFKVKNPNLWRGSSTKITKMIELFSQQSEDDKSLVICHYQEEIDIIHKYLTRAFPDKRIEIFNGQMDLNHRNACVKRCLDGEVDVLLIQIMAGGVGLNLQVFNKVYMMTPNWNPGNEIQAIARCHRIGQTRNVEVFKLIIKEEDIPTIDEKIINIQIDKRDLMAHYLGDDSLQFNENFCSQTGNRHGLNMRDMGKLLC